MSLIVSAIVFPVVAQLLLSLNPDIDAIPYIRIRRTPRILHHCFWPLIARRKALHVK